MEENTNALENALKQIQAWFVNGEFEKVKQGCEEILQLSPNNSIAQDLLQKSKEAHSTIGQAVHAPEIPPLTETFTEPEPPMPLTIPEPEPPMPEPVIIPEPNGQAIPMPAASEEPNIEEHSRPHSLIVNLVILGVLIILGIVGVYAYQAIKGTPEENTTTVTPPTEETVVNDNTDGKGETTEDNTDSINAEERNNQRLLDLTSVENALIYYYDAHKKYPLASEINIFLIDEGFIEAMPVPPTDNETYFYAVYDTDLGPAQAYILSGNFENEDGTFAPWSTGASSLNYPDYQDITLDNVTILSETITEETIVPSEEPVTPTEEITVPATEERVRVPRILIEQ